MSKWFQKLCVAGLLALTLAPAAFAQQGGPGGGGRGQGGRGGFGFRSPTQLPRELELTDDQKAKLADIEKKYADKLKAAQDKAKLTEAQTSAQREAFGKAREEGKQGDEARAAVEAALNLTDDQKKGREELAALTKEITTEVEGLLTDEQKAKLKELRETRRGPGGQGGQGGQRRQRNTN